MATDMLDDAAAILRRSRQNVRQEVSVSSSFNKYRLSTSTTVLVVPGVAAIFDVWPVNSFGFLHGGGVVRSKLFDSVIDVIW